MFGSYFQSNFTTENLKHSRGRLTGKAVERSGQMVGQVIKGVDAIFLGQMAEVSGYDDHFGKKWVWEKEVIKFVKEYQPDGLFDFNPGREHRGFPSFQWDITVSNPVKFKQRLIKYGKELDNIRDWAADG